MNDDRCPVCGSPLYVLKGDSSRVLLGCKNDKYPGNNNNPCPRYAGGDNPDPDLIKVIEVKQ